MGDPIVNKPEGAFAPDPNREIPIIPCMRCGVCCSTYNVHIGWLEAHHIADKLELEWEDFEQNYLESHWNDSSPLFLRRIEGKCIFLEPRQNLSGKASCRIHLFRPESCREWMPGLYRRLCREELTRHWGLSISPMQQLDGPEENLAQFRCFLGTLTAE